MRYINKIIAKISIILLIMSIFITGCQPSSQGQSAKDQPSGGSKAIISASGAFAIYPLMVRWGEEYQKINPNIKIDISAGGAGKGMSDALAGMVDIGMVSRDVKPEEITKGAFDIAITKDAVFATANAKNPALNDLLQKGISKAALLDIYINGKALTWGEVAGKTDIKDKLNVYTRSDACGAADVWALFLDNKKQENLGGIGVSGDPGIVEAVKKDPLGLGYNNLNYAYDATTGKPVEGIVVLPIDFNNNGKVDDIEQLDTKEKAVKAVASGQYPEPPARLLHLVTKGKPSGAVKDFLVWILNDGQKYQEEVGYIPMKSEKLNEQKEKLK